MPGRGPPSAGSPGFSTIQAQAAELPGGGGMGVLNPALQGLQGFSLGQDAASAPGVSLPGAGMMEEPTGTSPSLGAATGGLGGSIGLAGGLPGSGAAGGFSMFTPTNQSPLEGAALGAAAADPPGLTFGAAAAGGGGGAAAFMFHGAVAKPANGVDQHRQLGLGSAFGVPGSLGGLPNGGIMPAAGGAAAGGGVLSGMGFQNGVGALEGSGLSSFNQMALQNTSASPFY
eukprot:gene6083-6323_t